MRIIEQFRLACRNFPSRSAIINQQGGVWSYDYLEKIVDELAASLRTTGIRSGDVVGISIPRSNNLFVASKLAIWDCGGCATVLTNLPERRLQLAHELCGPKYVIKTSTEPNQESYTITEHINSNSVSALYVGFTSGSSGIPKAVVVSETSVINVFEQMTMLLSNSSWSSWLAVSPDSFDISYVELIYPLLNSKTCIVYLPKYDNLLTIVNRYQPHILQATPATWELLLAAGWCPQQFPLIRLVGGERFPPKLASKLLPNSKYLYNLYGPTEATIWCSAHRITSDNFNEKSEVPLGEVFQGNKFSINNNELCVKGVNVAEGYLRSVDGEDNFIEQFNGEYCTGDVVSISEEGQIFFQNRKDHQTKLRGNRIDLKEIENLALQIQSISSAVAVVQGEASNAVLVLFYTVCSTSKLNTDSVRILVVDHFKQHLSDYMRPTFVERLDQIPLTSSNKVDVESLPNVEDVYVRPVLSEEGGGKVTFSILTQIVTTLVKPLLESDDVRDDEIIDTELHPSIGSIGIVLLAGRLAKELSPIVKDVEAKWHPTEDGVPIILSCLTVSDLIYKLSAIFGITPNSSSVVRSAPKPKQKRAQIKSKGNSLPPLIAMSKEGSIEGVLVLLKDSKSDKNFDVDIKDRFGSTALHYAAGAGQLEICKALVSCGANDKLADKKSGRTALHWAARLGQLEICQWLVSEKSHNTELRAKDDTTPLQLAAWGGHIPTCKWFIALGSDINFINKWGCTAVHFSALAGAVPTVQWLYSIGLDLTFCNYQGHNTLHKAAYGGHRELCEWLLEGPPLMDITVKDVRNQTVDMLAVKAGYDELAVWLREKLSVRLKSLN